MLFKDSQGTYCFARPPMHIPKRAVFDVYPRALVDSSFMQRYVSVKDEIKNFRQVRKVLVDNLPKMAESTNYAIDQGSIQLGTDPEVFVVEKANPSRMIPAWMVTQTKRETRCEAGSVAPAYYPDGCGLEFSAYHEFCFGYLVDNLRSAMVDANIAAKKVKGQLCAQDVLAVPEEILAGAPDEFIQLGCSPSFNAYGFSPDIPEGRSLPYRTIGTHFHFGAVYLKDRCAAEINYLVRCMDALGSVLCTAAWGHMENPIRRKLYGAAGEYRRPEHGLEYRVQGALPMVHPIAYHFAASVLRTTMVLGSMFMYALPLPPVATIRAIVNDSNNKAAKKLLATNPLYKWVLAAAFKMNSPKAFKLLQKTLLSEEGLGAVLDLRPLSIVDNWALEGYWEAHSDMDRATVAGLFNKKAREEA